VDTFQLKAVLGKKMLVDLAKKSLLGKAKENSK